MAILKPKPTALSSRPLAPIKKCWESEARFISPSRTKVIKGTATKVNLNTKSPLVNKIKMPKLVQVSDLLTKLLKEKRTPNVPSAGCVKYF